MRPDTGVIEGALWPGQANGGIIFENLNPLARTPAELQIDSFLNSAHRQTYDICSTSDRLHPLVGSTRLHGQVTEPPYVLCPGGFVEIMDCAASNGQQKHCATQTNQQGKPSNSQQLLPIASPAGVVVSRAWRRLHGLIN
jgi:hypothetical protein